MPGYLKLIISVLVVLVAGGLLLFGEAKDGRGIEWVVPLLGLFMILAIWLFPEARKLPLQEAQVASGKKR